MVVITVISVVTYRAISADSHDLTVTPEKSDSKISRDLSILIPGSVEQQQENFTEPDLLQDLRQALQIEANGFVVIDAIAAGDPSQLKTDLEDLGLQQGAAFGGMVSGRFPVSAIAGMAQLDSLRFARPSYMMTDQGVAISQRGVSRYNFAVTGGATPISWRNDNEASRSFVPKNRDVLSSSRKALIPCSASYAASRL